MNTEKKTVVAWQATTAFYNTYIMHTARVDTPETAREQGTRHELLFVLIIGH